MSFEFAQTLDRTFVISLSLILSHFPSLFDSDICCWQNLDATCLVSAKNIIDSPATWSRSPLQFPSSSSARLDSSYQFSSTSFLVILFSIPFSHSIIFVHQQLSTSPYNPSLATKPQLHSYRSDILLPISWPALDPSTHGSHSQKENHTCLSSTWLLAGGKLCLICSPYVIILSSLTSYTKYDV